MAKQSSVCSFSHPDQCLGFNGQLCFFPYSPHQILISDKVLAACLDGFWKQWLLQHGHDAPHRSYCCCECRGICSSNGQSTWQFPCTCVVSGPLPQASNPPRTTTSSNIHNVKTIYCHSLLDPPNYHLSLPPPPKKVCSPFNCRANKETDLMSLLSEHHRGRRTMQTALSHLEEMTIMSLGMYVTKI